MQHVKSKKREKFIYEIRIGMLLISMISVLGYTSLYLIQNFYASSFFAFGGNKTPVYNFVSTELPKYYKKNNMDYTIYQKGVTHFKNLVGNNGYSVEDIGEKELPNAKKDAILMVLDMSILTKHEQDAIDAFVAKGGKIIFNFTSGFLDKSGVFYEENLVQKITGLSNIGYKKFSEFLTPRLLSPLATELPEGKALGLSLYDPVPIYDTSKEADAYITNWAQTEYLEKDDTNLSSAEKSGALWHGYHGAGKWVYFNFPMYVFRESNVFEYSELFRGVLNFLDSSVSIIPYPYIDSKNVVFVSEDTEYKYTNLRRFSNVSKKYKIPVTAFCVAKLAKQEKMLTRQAVKNRYLELGSHSYSHDKIVKQSSEVYEKEIIGSKEALEKITKHHVKGFRPPREELDNEMIRVLEEGGYHYVLGAAENRLTPYFRGNILTIAKHGTDDYLFFVKFDWSAQEILARIKAEMKMVTNLNGIYTLSTHTHLMNYKSNITILEDFFSYLREQKEVTPMNGKMINKRLYQKAHLTTQSDIAEKKILIMVANSDYAPMENVHYRIEVDPHISIEKVASEIDDVEPKLIKKSDSEYLLILKLVKPKSNVVVYLNYVEKN